MNRNISKMILPRNHRIGHQPVLNMPSLIAEIGHGARQPPRNKVVAIAETLTMFTYSAWNGMAYLNEEYSVPHPATSSPSASGRSKGARLVSPTIEMRYTTNDGIKMMPYQSRSWLSTIPDVDMVPANRNTPTNDNPMTSSYEMT